MLDELLSAIDRRPWYRGQIVHVERLPGREKAFGEIALHPTVQAYLTREGIRLYAHQARTIAALRAGRDVVLTTPTASGKTLAFDIPVLEDLLADRSATALHLYPLKALARDQLAKLQSLDEACSADARPAVYDGDTPSHRRAAIRRTARVILTNPHALHQYLPWHHQWARFYSGLRTIVIDEAHHYRGIYGSNVAHLLQRILRIGSHYGANPRIVVASASIANPEGFAHALTGRPAVAIDEDASGTGIRSVLFWDPMADPTTSLTQQASRMVRFLTTKGLQTICFARSRIMAERIAQSARRGDHDTSIQSYRAGYLPEERRDLEARLRSGAIRGIVSTTALESGIDIGGLDVAILVGFPGSLLSAWQQAGRAGRTDRPSLVVYMPYENPLDRFFLHQPRRFAAGQRESLVLPRPTERQRAGHLACAAAELPLPPDELGSEDQALAQRLTEAQILARTPSGLVYRGLRRAHEAFPLSELAGESVRLVCDGRTLETMDPVRARRDAFPGAVLLHQGETFVVSVLDLEQGTAVASRKDVDYYTHGVRSSEVEILSVAEEGTLHGTIHLSRGRVRVTESYLGFKTVHADRTVSISPLQLPPHTYETDGVWVTLRSIPRDIHEEDWMGALHGAEHALIAMAPLLVLCDAEDVAGVSTPRHPQTGAPTVLLFDDVIDGAGIAEVLYTEWPRLAHAALQLVSDCPCNAGCPACLLSPRCGSQNQPLSKEGARRLLEVLGGIERREEG
jgi:DEAD/DEAH box helicase domain-containing protein